MTPEERNEFGREIAAMRGGRGWTQQQLADEAGVSKRTIQNLEAGKVELQAGNLGKVLDALGYRRDPQPWSKEADGFLQMIGWRLSQLPEAEQLVRMRAVTDYMLFRDPGSPVGQG